MKIFALLLAFWLQFLLQVSDATTTNSLANATRLVSRQSHRPPPAKPHSPSRPNDKPAPHNSNFNPACGLEIPTPEIWKRDHKKISIWFEKQYQDYLDDPYSRSIALYLRNKYAPKAAPSSEFCDMVGACSINSCLNLNEAVSLEDRQMAYQVFEQISGIAHLFQSVDKAVHDAGSYMLGRSNEFVVRFSSAKRVERALQIRRKREQLGLALAQGLLLITNSILTSSVSTLRPSDQLAVSLTTSSFSAIVGSINAARDPVAGVSAGVENIFRGSFNKLLHDNANTINDDLRDLMIGVANNRNLTILDIIKHGDFLEPDPELYPRIRKEIERFVFATAINSIWSFDRAYILDVDAPSGCQADGRGPWQYKVCLAEFPKRSFWLYALDQSQEYDSFKNDQTQVRGPTGYHAFDSENDAYYGITLTDIVRSSLAVDRKKYQNAIANLELDKLGKLFQGENNLGKVPGAFSIPICRNPGGESISSVWQDKGRNYPCMCGEFAWNKGQWSLPRDRTERFLELTGLKFSEDWEDYCHSHNECKGKNNINLKARLDATRQPGDPNIPKDLKHPFYKCTDVKDHRHKGFPDRDY